MSNQNINIPYSPEYTDLILDTNKKFEDQVENILSVAQGEFVILKEISSIALMLKTLQVIVRVSPEIAFQTISGKNYVLYSSTSGKLIRPDNFDLSFINLNFQSRTEPTSTREINLDKINQKFKDLDETISIKNTLQDISSLLVKPQNITLTSSSSLLTILTLINFCGGAKKIFYKTSPGSVIEKIK